MTPEELRTIRKSMGLTQQAFGNLLGLNVTTIRDYEAGRQGIRKVVELAVKYIHERTT